MNTPVTSAIEYRPKLFKDIQGQHSITTILQNAIKKNHINQSYLFCGPRGVGKTTCARILSKALNCNNITTQAEPCYQCTQCKAQNTLNIYELDAASNNSVEDIRALIDQVRYPPQSGKYKIYIIDEVHMLSNAAFNAFLKTLEEPPKFVIFILATTEKHKVIPTIISRCQVLEFRRIKPQEIQKQLATIATKQNIQYEKEALQIISYKADGALRDALSMFDMIAAFNNYKNITYKSTIENLQILDLEHYFKISKAIIEKDIPNILIHYDQIVNSGLQEQSFIIGLTEHIQNLLMCKNKLTIPLVKTTDNFIQKYIEQSKKLHQNTLLQLINTANDCNINYRYAQNKRLHIEIALINMASNHQSNPEKNEQTQTINNKPKYTTPEKKTIKIPNINNLIEEAKTSYNNKDNNNTHLEATNTNKEEIKKYWQQYINTNKNPALPLTKITELEINQNTITIKIDNIIKKKLIESIKHDVTTFLQKKLNNPNIKIQTQLQEQPIENKKPYTNQEKFQHLAQKYPDILTLQKTLDLQL